MANIQSKNNHMVQYIPQFLRLSKNCVEPLSNPEYLIFFRRTFEAFHEMLFKQATGFYNREMRVEAHYLLKSQLVPLLKRFYFLHLVLLLLKIDSSLSDSL